ncbi:MAG: hypothetical protein DI598_02580 [Pseudopedobacter saltans]|uniref:Uncharacterized protein n=1 Tax=Pseudopedobacter saltans TaxID=151895 RepID=A0A2W5FBS2_9SPHI|nr:MAG: hypothetical protein DI598_02580 [Pseudopedobacter saltans]
MNRTSIWTPLTLIGLFFSIINPSIAQQNNINQIHTDFVKKERRDRFDQYLMNNTIEETFSSDLDEDTEDAFESSCLSATQFMIKNDFVKSGLNKMIAGYNTLSYSAKRAMLATIYSLYPTEYKDAMMAIFNMETNPKLFAITAVYLYRIQPDYNLQRKITVNINKIPGADSLPVLVELRKYISTYNSQKSRLTPNLIELFVWQKNHHIKTVYSFQRWNRDYAGIAVVQLEDGSFARDEDGKLLTFRQLARAASNLPYFLTNGNTPQGIFSINGTDVSRNLLIGPTPNIQTLLPFEKDSNFWFMGYDSAKTPFDNYIQLLPNAWRSYVPMMETFYAGKSGRSEIIMHGTTIESKYFKNEHFYPLAPTDGCLCANESWNSEDGYLAKSDQLGLINTFNRTAERRGLLFVINISNEQKPVSVDDIEPYVAAFENM